MKHCNILVLYTLLLCIQISYCSRILGIFPIGARSHFVLGNAYLRALADAGHDVTMVSPFEDKIPTKNGSYTNVILTGMIDKHQELTKSFFERQEQSPFYTLHLIISIFTNRLEETMSQPAMQHLINSKEKYDVVVVNQFFIEGFKMFAHHFNAHLIVFNCGEPNFGLNTLIGNPSPPSYIPDVWLGYSSKMTLWQRFENIMFSCYTDILMEIFLIPTQNKIMKKYFPNSPPLKEIVYNTSLVIIISHESFHQPIPQVPVMVPIGGFQLRKPSPLPNDLQEFLDNANEGVVYFSMGSLLQGKDMPEYKRKAIIQSFSKLRQKVLWKWENDTLPEKPDNVKISKWFPQNDILAHPNIKVFITQGGYLSTSEALYYGVPIITLPIVSDQKLNAINAARIGFCIPIPFNKLSEETLTGALNEILYNPKYSEVAKMRSKLIQDRPMNPTDTAVWWTEYIIRHNGAKHLRVAGLKLPWYSYYLLDVYTLLILFIILIAFISLKICCCIIKCKEINSKIKLN